MTMTQPAATPPYLDGLADLAAGLDAVILDLWGVVHNGIRPYPFVVETLAGLRAAGIRIGLLSNAPRRVASVAAKLTGMGIDPTHYDVLMTSGEMTRSLLLHPPDPWFAGLGRRCFHLGPPRDADLFDDLPVTRVDRVDEADFVVNTGIDRIEETVADHEPVLARAAALDLPMICANPDLVVTIGTELAICAGTLANRYEDLGGTVRWIGKPHGDVYQHCHSLLGKPPKDRVVAVGDSLRTDIAGARQFGIRSVLVTCGIHAEDFGCAPGARPDMHAIARVLATGPYQPDYLMAELAWGAPA